MTSSKDNIIFEKTSFLQGGNSPFIKELYLQYLNNPKTVPESWREFFDGLDEDQEIIRKEILGPSWAPRKKNIPLEKDLLPQKGQNTISISLDSKDPQLVLDIEITDIDLAVEYLPHKNAIRDDEEYSGGSLFTP